MKHILPLVGFALIVGISACAYAQPSSDDGKQRRGPPPEAFTACESKSQGDSCTVSTPKGELSGTCEMPKGDKLVCAPEGGRERGDAPQR